MTLILSQNWKEFETREESLSYFYDYVISAPYQHDLEDLSFVSEVGNVCIWISKPDHFYLFC